MAPRLGANGGAIVNELGQWLRETREAKGYSLAEVEAQTRIRQKFLAAMEAEEWTLLPGDVTTRGFLRKYATFLELDPNQVIQAYLARGNKLRTAETLEVPQVPAEREVDYRPIEMDLSHVQPRRIPWRWLALVALVLVIGLGAWYVWAYRPAWVTSLTAWSPSRLPNPANLIAIEPTATPSPTTIVIRVTATPTATWQASPTPSPTATPEPGATGAPQGGESATPTAAVAAPLAENLRLQLQTLARSWVRVVADDKIVMEAVLEPGQTGDWQAQKSIVLRTGNAAGVELTVNDKKLSTLGGPGEVIEVRWSLEDGKVVQTTPTPAPVATSTPAGAGETQTQAQPAEQTPAPG